MQPTSASFGYLLWFKIIDILLISLKIRNYLLQKHIKISWKFINLYVIYSLNKPLYNISLDEMIKENYMFDSCILPLLFGTKFKISRNWFLDIHMFGKCAIWCIGSRCRVAILSTIWYFVISVVFQTLGKDLELQLDLYELFKFWKLVIASLLLP